MTVKIVLPEQEKKEIRTAIGTRVFTEDGAEINDITDIDIHLSCDGIMSATIKVAVYDIENMGFLDAQIVKKKRLTFFEKLKALFLS